MIFGDIFHVRSISWEGMKAFWNKRLLVLVAVLVLVGLALFAYFFAREKDSAVTRPLSLDLRPDRYSALAGRESPQWTRLQEYFWRHYKGELGQGDFLLQSWPLEIWADADAELVARRQTDMRDFMWQVDTAGESLTALAEDQLAYLEYLICRGQKRAFFRQLRTFQNFFLCPAEEGAGFYRQLSFHGQEELHVEAEIETVWSKGLQYLRVLALAESQWPRAQTREAIAAQFQQLEGAIKNLSPSVKIVSGEIVYPLVGSAEPFPEGDEPQREEAVLAIADLDLFALRALTELDLISKDLYEKYLAIVVGSARGGGFFAAYYAPETASYVLGSRAFLLRSETSLTILSHLLEVADPQHEDDVQQWFLRFYARGTLASSYHLVTGEGMGEPEPVALARLGRLAALQEQLSLHADIGQQLAALGQAPPYQNSGAPVYLAPDGRRLISRPQLEMLLAGY